MKKQETQWQANSARDRPRVKSNKSLNQPKATLQKINSSELPDQPLGERPKLHRSKSKGQSTNPKNPDPNPKKPKKLHSKTEKKSSEGTRKPILIQRPDSNPKASPQVCVTKHLSIGKFNKMSSRIFDLENQTKVKILNRVRDLGGFEQVYTKNLWSGIKIDAAWLPYLPTGFTSDDLFSYYTKNLLHYDYVSQNKSLKLTPSKIYPWNFSILQRPTYIYSQPDLDAHLPTYLNHPVLLLKNFAHHWNIDPNIFTSQSIGLHHGHNIIDVVSQRPFALGFKTKSNQLLQTKQKITIAKYIAYQKDFIEHKKNFPDEKIKFGVNIDIGDWKEMKDELLSKVPKYLYCNGEEDYCRYLRQHIMGMTQPQVYLKVPGCWTGGHQENLNMRAVNVNHGPGDVEWYWVDTPDIAEFRRIVKEKENIDIHGTEHLWYVDLSFFYEHGIRVGMFVQEAGDVVVLAPGVLHWVRAHGAALHSAWNLGEFSLGQLQAHQRKYLINNEIGMQNLIPTQTCFMDLLNLGFKKWTNDAWAFLISVYKKTLQECEDLTAEIDLYLTAKPIQKKMDDLGRNSILACSNCHREIFNDWFHCPALGTDAIFCFPCYKIHTAGCTAQNPTHTISKKYTLQDLYSLLKISETLSNPSLRRN